MVKGDILQIADLHQSHYADLHKIALAVEPFKSRASLTEFSMEMVKREGITLLREGRVMGAITYSDFIPGTDIIMHAFMSREVHGHWMTKRILWHAFSFPFDDLKLPRVSGYCVKGISDYAGRILERLGFVQEGIRRKGFKIGDDLFDLKIFGMLKEECRWL